MNQLGKRWYNGLTQQLKLDRQAFQLSRSSSPVAVSDSALWGQMDAVPPAKLIFDREASEFSRLSKQHEIIVNRLGFGAEASLKRRIGEEPYRKWSQYLSQTPAPVAVNRLPSMFLNWAMLHSPVIATVGASSLSASILARNDPDALIESAAVEPPREFEGSCAELRERLLQAGGAAFDLRLDEMPEDTGDAWASRPERITGGSQTPDSDRVDFPADRYIDRILDSERISVAIRFSGLAVWPAKPGAWYNADAMRIAYESRDSPLWAERAGYGWDHFFGPNGAFVFAMSSLVVADGISAEVRSGVSVDREDRAQIEREASQGLWPFFVPDSEIAKNSVRFSDSGFAMGLATRRGNPVVIGENVVRIQQYLQIDGD